MKFVYQRHQKEVLATSQFDVVDWLNELGANGELVVHFSEGLTPSKFTDGSTGKVIPNYCAIVITARAVEEDSNSE